jgi:hypothetical protein
MAGTSKLNVPCVKKTAKVSRGVSVSKPRQKAAQNDELYKEISEEDFPSLETMIATRTTNFESLDTTKVYFIERYEKKNETYKEERIENLYLYLKTKDMISTMKVRATPTAKKSLEKEHEIRKYFKTHYFFINVLGERVSANNYKYHDFCVFRRAKVLKK